jgi:hypothetical protein
VPGISGCHRSGHRNATLKTHGGRLNNKLCDATRGAAERKNKLKSQGPSPLTLRKNVRARCQGSKGGTAALTIPHVFYRMRFQGGCLFPKILRAPPPPPPTHPLPRCGLSLKIQIRRFKSELLLVSHACDSAMGENPQFTAIASKNRSPPPGDCREL